MNNQGNKRTRLFGGHRNDVFKTNGFVKVVWKNGFKRRDQLREAVLLENFVSTHTDIKARMLVDKSKPVQAEGERLVTNFYYVDGEIRYPWSLDEIASAVKLLTRLHSSMNPAAHDAPNPTRHLHLDFARGNVLFQPGSSDAIGVIDFENTTTGLVEQELGRTLSFLLVDTPTRNDKLQMTNDKLMKKKLRERAGALLTNYGLPYRREKAVEWTKRYLIDEDYGDRNQMRSAVLRLIESL